MLSIQCFLYHDYTSGSSSTTRPKKPRTPPVSRRSETAKSSEKPRNEENASADTWTSWGASTVNNLWESEFLMRTIKKTIKPLNNTQLQTWFPIFIISIYKRSFKCHVHVLCVTRCYKLKIEIKIHLKREISISFYCYIIL